MVSKESRARIRMDKHRRIRHRLAGTALRPRLAVFRSNNHMYVQVIDDTCGNTLVSASTLDADVKADLAKDWLAKGVQPTETVKNLLVKAGVIAKSEKLSPSKTKGKKSNK